MAPVQLPVQAWAPTPGRRGGRRSGRVGPARPSYVCKSVPQMAREVARIRASEPASRAVSATSWTPTLRVSWCTTASTIPPSRGEYHGDHTPTRQPTGWEGVHPACRRGARQVHATGAGRQRGQPSSPPHAGTQGFHHSLPETRPTHARRQALPAVSAVGAPGVPGRAAGAAGPRCSGGPSWRPRQPGRRRTWWPPSPPGAQRRTGRRRGGCGRPAAHLIWRAWLSSGSWACRLLGGEDVVMSAGGAGNLRRRAVGLRCAGWLPHDRGASERSAGLAIERHPAVGSAGLLIGASRVALALGMAPHRPAVGVGQASRTARLQHHPASSRATATTLMVERLARASSRHQRWWSRRLPRSARSRTAAGWPA